MKGKSPIMKALVGNQENLNEGLKAAIKAAPGKVMEKTPMNMKMESAVKMGMAKKPAPIKIAKPDFPDVDGDGNRKESISKASADKKASAKKTFEKTKSEMPRLKSTKKASAAKIRTEGEDAKKRARKEKRDHNKAARKTEGTKLMQAARRKFGKNKAK